MKVKEIRYKGKADVYNMEVEDTHSFVVNGGIVAHNCYDEARYFCMARPVPVKMVSKETPRGYDPFDNIRRH